MDDFFKKTECDRCKGDLKIRTVSWFTEETVCLNCRAKDNLLRSIIDASGKDSAAYEGCGYIPDVKSFK